MIMNDTEMYPGYITEFKKLRKKFSGILSHF